MNNHQHKATLTGLLSRFEQRRPWNDLQCLCAGSQFELALDSWQGADLQRKEPHANEITQAEDQSADIATDLQETIK